MIYQLYGSFVLIWSSGMVRNRTLLSASRKALGAVVVIVCFDLALWFSKDLVLDLSSGSQTVELKDIQVSESLHIREFFRTIII